MNKEYYPIQKNWKKLRPIFESPRILQIMHSEMECFNEDRANVGGFEYKRLPFDLSLRPSRYDSCDWRFDRYREDGELGKGRSQEDSPDNCKGYSEAAYGTSSSYLLAKLARDKRVDIVNLNKGGFY